MTKPKDDLAFNEVHGRLVFNDDMTEARIVRQQEIPDSFWDQVAEIKHVQDHAPVGDFHMVASIPELTVERWFREGFNMFDPNVTIQDVLKRLRAEDADKLITTSRTV